MTKLNLTWFNIRGYYKNQYLQRATYEQMSGCHNARLGNDLDREKGRKYHSFAISGVEFTMYSSPSLHIFMKQHGEESRLFV